MESVHTRGAETEHREDAIASIVVSGAARALCGNFPIVVLTTADRRTSYARSSGRSAIESRTAVLVLLPSQRSQKTDMSKGTFARLPVELLKAVRANLHCLKDVVAFSQINKAAAKICDEAYWKKALIVAGFGRPTKPLIQLPKKWAALARIIVADSKRYARHDPRFGKDGYITEAGALAYLTA